jgi:hypothetical protein
LGECLALFADAGLTFDFISMLLEGLFGVEVLFPLLAVILDFCTKHGFGFELFA